MNIKKQIDLVIGTRPNIIKAAPLYHALGASDWATPRLVFLQQHTDPALSTQTMEDVGLAPSQITMIPLHGLNYGDRLGCMVSRYAELLHQSKPDLVTVFGDVDTTLAAAVAAKREHCLLAHVEAGLRSGDRGMPEELNRIMVDSISDLLLTTTHEARNTLLHEGQPESCVHFVGNLMIDSLLVTVDDALGRSMCAALGVLPHRFLLATFHRPSNVDTAEGLSALIKMLRQLVQRMPVVFPIHPRTRAALEREGMLGNIDLPGLIVTPPMRYREFVSLQSVARVVISDSGGMQEECAVLGVNCLTIRDTTERPNTLTQGNELSTPAESARRLDALLTEESSGRNSIKFWDGCTSSRTLPIMCNFLLAKGSKN
ncbi:UDP-N-acetylglucosamine 2-epimerase (non-hydrolyzing) [Stenotrophomonas sp.]|uniref:non-hydrolyzing UDP-N-acetylglucosamine 2-epimerase n=1 Tax=Stenotrophomonas sp. TaxID=69392 RepID=UPI0028A9E25C|nr:UDP-N-acetylglucosamine 2-epimerase (non-hydrolyzing) [Stenotrophomonas sp.]